tara:strand:- start:563 stop:736 length:174 start_codon:yes stop_codon:yes gene_type:complete
MDWGFATTLAVPPSKSTKVEVTTEPLSKSIGRLCAEKKGIILKRNRFKNSFFIDFNF